MLSINGAAKEKNTTNVIKVEAYSQLESAKLFTCRTRARLEVHVYLIA